MAKSMVESSARKDKLKQLIENLTDEQADSLAEQLTNRQATEHPGTYKLYGDTEPSDVYDKPIVKYPGSEFHMQTTLDPDTWAQHVVDLYKILDKEMPERIVFKGKVYDLSHTPATRSPRPGVPGTPEVVETNESIF